VANGRDAKLAANWVTGELFALLNRTDTAIERAPIAAEALGELVGLISDGTISGRIAKQVFDIMAQTGARPGAIVEEHGLTQVTDQGAIETVIDRIIAANPDQVAQVRERPKAIGWFVGQVMKATQGKANPQAVNDILRARLGLD
jgi:aspartyl-tRNA(Asn)/glutamyl-tRNA(Gln) amidotransferase subunit B